MAVKNMLQSANIKKDGTLRAGRLSRQLDGGQLTNEQVKEVLGQRICSIGLSLTINTLYEKGGTFKMQMPATEVQKTYYKQSVEEVASGVNVTSTWTQHDSSQWSDAGSSAQASP